MTEQTTAAEARRLLEQAREALSYGIDCNTAGRTDGPAYLHAERFLSQAKVSLAAIDAHLSKPAEAPRAAAQPAAWWIPKAEQFCLAKPDGRRPFAKAWEPLYATPPAGERSPDAQPEYRESEPTHQHITSGGLYTVRGRGKLQTAVPVSDMEAIIAYEGEDGRWWFRPAAEFNERFKRTVAGERSTPAEPTAWVCVLAERRRQVSVEGWTPEHDDSHKNGDLALAAACYASNAASWLRHGQTMPHVKYRDLSPGSRWPWQAKWWKPTNERRDLVKAAALILAEIERLDRANAI